MTIGLINGEDNDIKLKEGREKKATSKFSGRKTNQLEIVKFTLMSII